MKFIPRQVMAATQTRNVSEIELTNEKIAGDIEPNPIVVDENVSFLYGIHKLRGRDTVLYEEGIGTIQNGILSRVTPLGVGSTRLLMVNAPTSHIDFSCEEGETLMVETIMPLSVSEAYPAPHSMLVSDNDGLKSIVLNDEEFLIKRGGEIVGVTLQNATSHLITAIQPDPPADPYSGMGWLNTTSGKLYLYINQWVEI